LQYLPWELGSLKTSRRISVPIKWTRHIPRIHVYKLYIYVYMYIYIYTHTHRLQYLPWELGSLKHLVELAYQSNELDTPTPEILATGAQGILQYIRKVLYVYVCMCVCMYLCTRHPAVYKKGTIHVCMYVCMYAQCILQYIRKVLYMYVCMYVCMYVQCILQYIRKVLYMYVCMYVCMYSASCSI
jgi:hypothetical protein